MQDYFNINIIISSLNFTLYNLSSNGDAFLFSDVYVKLLYSIIYTSH